MSKKNEILNQEQSINQEKGSDLNVSGNKRKPFIEPEVSVPVDVLEATTFFQATSSGVTN